MSVVLVEVDARGVATVVLNTPEKHNVLSDTMADALVEAFAALGADAAVRAIVLTGAGKSFCAGGDLGWMRRQFEADRATRIAEARRLAMMLFALNTCPKPVIARVNGTAMGGGLGLMCVADVAVVADTGKFGFTETRLGVIPATISPYVMARMGEGAARRVMMSARVFDAGELVPLGLAAKVVAPDDLDAAVAAEVEPYLSCAPGAVARTKALVRSLGPVIDETVIAETITALADTWEGAEAQAGIAAFFAREPAPFARGKG
ncbi:crotonase/enoyl-CoA hydratase family protein [Algicella marina]|uniref:Crotonase/enoyl-CoA hydratase family protein n=1 Tax=Algicella marina TaxID=2683284 RepID=A0A6P1T1H8_9RHOB|nr:crotonase/enoyl-CoA hydratase family protein [Algicella marina]QHQ35837.1 crotonase/enoyl-CoA hydratase family protein [Algicella marina]